MRCAFGGVCACICTVEVDASGCEWTCVVRSGYRWCQIPRDARAFAFALVSRCFCTAPVVDVMRVDPTLRFRRMLRRARVCARASRASSFVHRIDGCELELCAVVRLRASAEQLLRSHLTYPFRHGIQSRHFDGLGGCGFRWEMCAVDGSPALRAMISESGASQRGWHHALVWESQARAARRSPRACSVRHARFRSVFDGSGSLQVGRGWRRVNRPADAASASASTDDAQGVVCRGNRASSSDRRRSAHRTRVALAPSHVDASRPGAVAGHALPRRSRGGALDRVRSGDSARKSSPAGRVCRSDPGPWRRIRDPDRLRPSFALPALGRDCRAAFTGSTRIAVRHPLRTRAQLGRRVCRNRAPPSRPFVRSHGHCAALTPLTTQIAPARPRGPESDCPCT